MVAGDEDHLFTVAGPPEHLLDDRVLCGAPVDAPIHRPEIDDVADQEELVGGVFAQEFEQALGLAGAGSEVDIGEEDGADLRHESIVQADCCAHMKGDAAIASLQWRFAHKAFAMTQDELKRLVAQAAVDYVKKNAPQGSVIGVGTGSTANCFIDALAPLLGHFCGAVASSEASRERLEAIGFKVFDLNEVSEIPFYVDGADEVDASLSAIKGGGAALTREKIVAAVASRFICIADASKKVEVLGRFPLPVEVIPMARAHVARRLKALGGEPKWREGVITDNGNLILDVHGLAITDPVGLESEIDHISGVVTNGLFARRPVDLLLLSTPDGVASFARD